MPTGTLLAQVFKYNLSQIGCDVQVKLFTGSQIYTAAGQKGANFDAALAGWNQDYPDPYDFLDVLLNGNNIHDSNNNNLAYFNVKSINDRLDRRQQAQRRRALQRVRQARRRHLEELRAVGRLRQPQRA